MADAGAVSARTGRLPELAKYEVLEEIGHGGMATVYRAKDKRLAREVAVKVIHPHLRDSPEVAHRFSVEARAVAKLRHGNIVEVYDVSGEDEPEQYLVVELLRGVTLRKLFQRRAAVGEEEARGPLPPEVAGALAIELLNALAHAHAAGVIHRDVKPENVIIEHRTQAESTPPSDGSPHTRVLVKLTDFGIAKLLDAQGVTSTGQVLGSPAHMAPEQIEGGEVDARADVFGLGVLLYECMVGHLPFEGNNPAQVLRRVLEGIYPSAEGERSTIGKTWSALLDRALAHDPQGRFADAAAMRDAIQAELARVGIDSPRAELEAWFDDPEGYETTHAKQLVERLCARAAEARKKGDALSAAADYNRALAYAPGDPGLLKIVGSMHRAEVRARILKQAGRAAALMVLLGVVAFAATRAFVGRSSITADTSPSAKKIPSAQPLTSAPVSPSDSPSASTTASAVSTLPHVVIPTVPKSATPPKMRTISISLRPEQGIFVSIDGGGQTAASNGMSIPLDVGPHDLVFACDPKLPCLGTVSRHVNEGEDDQSVSAVLRMKDAILTVVGSSSSQYQLSGRPDVVITPGTPVSVSMTYESTLTSVVQLPQNKSQTVKLLAGKSVSVTFAD
jgi:serine/threonine-protein kinase